jgi:hypothetical protein
MASVKLEDCSQTLELNVTLKMKKRFLMVRSLLFIPTSHCALKVAVELFHDELFQ